MSRLCRSAVRVSGAFLIAVGFGALVACSAVGPGPSVEDSTRPVAAFYGDSYTHGDGASEQSLRWSTLISEQRDWTELNPSVPGLGFVNNRDLLPNDLVELIVAEEPDIVIVTMGLNDNFLPPATAEELEKAISDDLETFADELPDARLIVVEPFWYTDDRPDSVETIIGWVRDAAVEVGAEYIAGASHWIEGHPEWMSIDGIHPNDAGHAAIAERMDEELTGLGL